MVENWAAAGAIASGALVITSLGGIAYASLQLRHERSYRAISNLEKQLDFFQSNKFRESRRLLARDRLDTASSMVEFQPEDPPVSVFAVLDFYEHLGLLVKKGHLELYDVWHTFYEWIQPVYSDLRVGLENRSLDWAEHYSDLRSLARGMDRIQHVRMRRKGRQKKLWSPERVAEYYRYELESQGESFPRRLRAGRPADSHASSSVPEPAESETPAGLEESAAAS